MTEAPHITGPVPGPGSQAVERRRQQFMPRALASSLGIAAAGAEGVWLWDPDGNRYLDFTGGVGVLNVGHRHPTVTAAVKKQLAAFLHTDFQVIMYEPLTVLAQRLAACAPIKGPAKAAFFNAGAEAVENAVKFARAYTGRPGLIAFEYGFHGRTWMALSLTGRVDPFRTQLGGMVPDIHHLPFPHPHHPPFGRLDLTQMVMEAMDRLFATRISARDVAAVIVEPVQGEGGVVVPPPDFLPALAARCRAEGILLIADEIQTGFGRTGRLFGVEHTGVEPDLLVVAKAMAAGLPLSGVVGRAEIMDAPGPGAIGGTFVGNPVAAAAALAVLDVLDAEGLAERADRLGQLLQELTAGWTERHPLVGDVRNLGLMAGIEMAEMPGTAVDAGQAARSVVLAARDEGLLVLRAGPAGRVVRLLPPLTLEPDQLRMGLAILDRALTRVEQEAGPGSANGR